METAPACLSVLSRSPQDAHVLTSDPHPPFPPENTLHLQPKLQGMEPGEQDQRYHPTPLSSSRWSWFPARYIPVKSATRLVL